MIRSVLRDTARNLRHNRGFALLNVGGLALGMACVILIALFVRHETQFDTFHERADRVVRMDLDEIEGGETEHRASTHGLLAPALNASIPEVETAVRLLPGRPIFEVGGEVFQPGRVYYADPGVLDVFSFPLVTGDPATALADPGRIVLTETTARTLFGRTDVVGESVVSGANTLTVSGVMADVPSQSHLQFHAMASLATLEDPGFYYTWRTSAFLTYALLREGADLEGLDAKLTALLQAEMGDILAEEDYTLALQATPLEDAYLYSEHDAGDVQGSLQVLQILGAIALFVLLIAGVNFTNLATARSMDRAREVGVRKTLGAGRAGLAARFLIEAVVLCLLAFGLGLVLAAVVLPGFETLTGNELALADLGVWTLGLAGLAVGVGLVAGAYPSLVLSGFRPADVLKGRFATGARGATLRRGLVAVQFTVSIALIAATVVVFSQIDHMQSRDLGIDLDGGGTQLVVLPFEGGDPMNPFGESDAATGSEATRQLVALPGVTGVTSSSSAPTGGHNVAGGELEMASGETEDFLATMYMVDSSFVDVYGLEIVAGAAPGAATMSDSVAAYVLNETAVREAGYPSPQAALGAGAEFWSGPGVVVGVVRDFHVEGLQTAVEPLALVASDMLQSVLTLRVGTARLPQTLDAIDAIWPDLVPSRPFTYSFLDEDFGAQYAAEQQFSRVLGALSALAILIACLGLFGLAAYEVSLRSKEIGVRRVLGATVGQIVVLLSRNVVALVAVGAVISVPLVLWGMSRWLDGFAYRIEVGWMPLALAGALVLAVALVTVGTQAFRAAVADPVRALRSE
ncbi:ABC transporter permease [Rubrivirga sp.]|uniref:ABC transporter permease n=1 Tax=Rubrivirga sp. TaxID=1885344 RepID=UPI003C7167FD